MHLETEGKHYLFGGWVMYCRPVIRRDLLSRGSSHRKTGKTENRSATPNKQFNGEEYQQAKHTKSKGGHCEWVAEAELGSYLVLSEL